MEICHTPSTGCPSAARLRTRAILFFALFWTASDVVAAPAPAEIVSLQGKGQFSADGQATWRPAVVKQTLAPTNYVRTLDLSKMGILLPDRTQMDVGPNSVVQIMGPEESTTVRIPSGRVWSQSKSPPKRLVIETPAALAAIRGTDWEIRVDSEGRATLSVFSGEVEFYNDLGNLVVRANEQARAEKGRAPVKLQLVVSRSRIQWVSSFTIEPLRYAELRDGAAPGLAEIAQLVREQNLGEAFIRLKALTAAQDAPAASSLLLADFEIYRGESTAAREILERAAKRFPGDERFDVSLARIALLDGDLRGGRTHGDAAVAKSPQSADAWLLQADIERLEGRAERAIAAYSRAAAASARDARAWKGIGVVESERENVARARSNLELAISLDESDAGARAELGTLEAFAGNLARGRTELEAAIRLQPDNYIALTGMGVLELKAGRVDESIDALLRASLIEPRYSRAHLYLAAAYYQARRDADALAELQRAAETDPKDPLPYLLASIIHLDRIEPGRAIAEARKALERIPFAKSLNQVADNQKGVANVGAPLAFMGLEAWARSAAHESYLPFWGGSHLFLADRYPGAFNQRSELMQGFIADPLSFGATNRFQSLFIQPGRYATASLRHSSSDDFRVTEPVVSVNGYDVSPFPFAYFAEAIDTRVEPRDTALDARARTYTAAIGVRPVHELGMFIYANRISINADLGRAGVSGGFTRIDGNASRVDGGLRFAPDSRSSLWIKAGVSNERAEADDILRVVTPEVSFSQRARLVTHPRVKEGALRYTIAASEMLEITTGVEKARQRLPIFLVRDSAAHFDNVTVPQDTLDQVDHDTSSSGYVAGRWGDGWLRVEVGAMWSDYRKERDIHVSRDSPAGAELFVTENYRRRRVDPMLGVTWRPAPALTARAACRRWLRPISLDTLAPVAVAGVPLDDQLVFAGGELEQCRMQWEWSYRSDGFASVHFERVRAHNLVSPLDGVLNTRTDVTNVDRLRNRTLTPPAKPDLLEDVPVYGEGTVRRATLAIEQIATAALAARFHYSYTDSENTGAQFEGRHIPYLPRHHVNLGLTWAPGWRTFITAQAVYRTRRYIDEANTFALRSGWDARVNLSVESADKRWAVEAYAANLLKKDVSDIFGAILSYRF